jgi:anti-sigma factor RsiW
MNITRHNYEEFFMLYADNELSAEQRREVELFVEANPDLKPEFNLFFSLKLHEDPSVTLGDKSFLFRKAPSVPEEIQTQMLLHLDGELPSAEAASLEARISEDNAFRQEWEILNRAKLQPETEIRFPDRQLLYRHAATGARVLHIRWVRYAAAAAVVLIAGLLWLNNPEANGPQSGSVTLAGTDAGSPQRPADNPEGAVSAEPGENAAESSPAPAVLEGGVAEKQIASMYEPSKANTRQDVRRVAEQQNSNQPPSRETSTPVLTVTSPIPVETAGEVPQTTVQVSPEAGMVVRDITDQPVGMEGIKADYATQALAMQAQDEEYITETMYRENDRGRKGFRGLVRKANRIFNKVTNPDLDRTVVKVANVEIGLGR